MIYRTTTPSDLTYVSEFSDFDIPDWLSDLRNIALVNDNGDINLFQYDNGQYIGHYFYRSRGREALKVAEEMLDAIFRYEEVDTLVGLTPDDKRGAKWLSRQLGFQSHGPIEHPLGPCELFVLTRKQYEEKA